MNLLYDLVANILAAFYSFIPDYAASIVLLTLLVMAVTTPLVLKSTRSMMVMQQLQPEMKKIQARYKDDRQRQNEELLKFYRENNINPLGGCIPLLVQMPVFFILYQILRGLTRRVSEIGYEAGFNSGQFATNQGLSVARAWYTPFDPAYLDHNSQLYQSLQGSTTMNALSMDLSLSLTETWNVKGLVASVPYVLLIAIVAFTSFYQQRQIQGRNPNAVMSSQQQTLMKIMPVVLPLISLSLPAGLVLYFAVSNLWRVGLQGFISRSIYGIKRRGGSDPGTGDRASKKEPKPVGPTSAARGGARGGSSGDGKASGKGSNKGQGARQKQAVNKKQAVSKARGSDRSASAKNEGARQGSGRPEGSRQRSAGAKTEGKGSSPSLQPRARKSKKR